MGVDVGCVATALLTIMLTAALLIIVVMVIVATIDIVKQVSRPRIIVGQRPKWLQNKHYDYATNEALKIAWIEDKLLKNEFDLNKTQQFYNVRNVAGVNFTSVTVYLFPYKYARRSVRFDIKNGYTLECVGYSRS